MSLCWSCQMSEYHNYKDSHGIRCPRCGQKEKDDPVKVKSPLSVPRDIGGMIIGDDAVITTREPKAPVKRAARSKS